MERERRKRDRMSVTETEEEKLKSRNQSRKCRRARVWPPPGARDLIGDLLLNDATGVLVPAFFVIRPLSMPLWCDRQIDDRGPHRNVGGDLEWPSMANVGALRDRTASCALAALTRIFLFSLYRMLIQRRPN
ncbi:hypothetical protein EVAR_34746_1 [Eumeta japonica]|uniref:Uncharacterized protein n=1 Tax=Eumeta variegata TaxID=151549 RepID=A0A4C1YL69_EUMVA|nr:hypothetical protein EVAR_34746_1 [Eumeta japonica]